LYNSLFESNQSRSNNYQIIKKNVDNLKIIQIGITLADKDGNMPNEISTWQFNFKFDVENDICTPESISLLENAGINFKKFLKKGICPSHFAEYLISSGLVLNDNVTWVTFHGIYDLAYLLKLLTNQKLPESEALLIDELAIYFHNYYDIRHLIKELNWLRGSLTKLSSYFGIQRVGSAHQAGSDSLVTSKLFFKIVDQFSDEIDLIRDKNTVFGISDENENYYNPRQQQSNNEIENFKLNNNKFVNAINYQNNQKKLMMNQKGMNVTDNTNQLQQSNYNALNLQNSMYYNNNYMNKFFVPQNTYYNSNVVVNKNNNYPLSQDHHKYEMMSRYSNNNVQNEEYYISGNIVSN
jgi:CCR4-NOT transcription complex subunit 7/8